MNELHEDILIADNLGSTALRQTQGYITHALCRQGGCSFFMGPVCHHFAAGDCLIIPQQSLQMNRLEASDDFVVEVIYVKSTFIQNSTPQSNYGMRGHLALFENPVMHLNEEQQQVCALNFDYIRRRLALPHHHFHLDAMLNAVQCMIIDFFDFHVELYGDRPVSSQQAVLMERFLSLLDGGEYRRYRDVGHYAAMLCVTPKYLSEVCHKVSGQSALYWITRYTALDISRQLRRRDLTLDEVSDLYGFSSLSYFARYVQKHLGAHPSELRG
ncbi:MAG: AraC family transcriptional regulator [Bacteroidales bacterium]|nr:AraC family transcriptional regulator [Bacteroidales bacterium]